MTRALLFDLGNVLVAFDFARGYRALEGHAGLPVQDIRERITASGLVHPYERGEISSRVFYEGMTSTLDLDLDYDQFCNLWSVIFLPDSLVADDLVAGLHRRFPLVLISNTNEIHFQMIRQTYPILRHFDAFVLSYEVGAMKPAEAIYEEAVRQAGCSPEECFYTDDVLEFIDAGRRLGLDAVPFTGQADLERHLRERRLLD